MILYWLFDVYSSTKTIQRASKEKLIKNQKNWPNNKRTIILEYK